MRLGLKSMFYKYNRGFNERDHGLLETANKELAIVCCRRDSAALQAVVTADEDFLLTTSRDALFWKGGRMAIARIEAEIEPRLPMEVKLIGLMEDDDRCLKSDPLLDQNHICVDKGSIQQVWIECYASEDTPAGQYKGKVRLYVHTMFGDEELVEENEFALTVKERILPEPRDYSFYLDLWQHNSNIARKYQVELWSDEHFRIIDRYLESLAALGQKAATVIVSEIPWSGQNGHKMMNPSDMFEYNIIRVTKTCEGRFDYDFSALDRYITIAAGHGITEEIEVFGLLNIWQDEIEGYGSIVEGHPDGIRVRYFDEESRTFRFIRQVDELNAYIQALFVHMREQGWLERVRVVADEPWDFAQFQERLDALRTIAPDVRYKAAIGHADFIRRNLPGLTDYVPYLGCVADEYESLMELKDAIQGKLLYYVACNPDRPNTFIGSPSIECRMLPWLAERLGLDGFLRWNYTVWPDRPLEMISYRSPMFKAGDTNFVYPGMNGGPLLSLRYKWLQRGIRDYELMQQLKKEGYGEQVAAVVGQAFRFSHPAELSPEANRKASDLYSLDDGDYDRLIWNLG